MTEIIDVGELYYKEKWQGERIVKEVNDGVILYPLHATSISHCISKACQLFTCTEKGIKIPFSAESRKKMEIGKAFHKLHQQDVDWGLSELYDDRFGWYPVFHCTEEGHTHWIENSDFIEHSMTFHIQISEDKWIVVKGTLDEFKLNSEGFFIEDIKATFGFKWIKGARGNHKIQLHVYMWLLEQITNKDYPFPDNFPMTTYSKKWLRYRYKESYDKLDDEERRDWTFESYFDYRTDERDKCFFDLNFDKCRKGQIKYIDAFNPMRTKICKVHYRGKYFEFIEEQIEKYKQFILTQELPEPNYEYMAKWECDPKYCPFSRNSPLGVDCPFSRHEKNDK